MKYVDGFVLPVPKKKLKAYRALAQKASKLWREHGALEYRECVGEDLRNSCGLPFPAGIKARKGETVVLAWIVYKSRAHRDQVNARIMADKRIGEMCDPKNMPFDPKRMLYGGFEIIVEDLKK